MKANVKTLLLITFLSVVNKVYGKTETRKSFVESNFKSGAWQLMRPLFINDETYTSFITEFRSKITGLDNSEYRVSIPAYFENETGNIYEFKTQTNQIIKFELVYNSDSVITSFNFINSNLAKFRSLSLANQIVNVSGNNSYVYLNNTQNNHFTEYDDYRDFFNEARNISKNNSTIFPYKQIVFEPLVLKYKVCKKVLFVNFCKEGKKTIDFGLVLSDKDDPDNKDPNNYPNHYFSTISDITAFSAPLITGEYNSTNRDYALTAVISDNSAERIAFFREGQTPIYYGNSSAEGSMQNPLAVKFIGSYLYVLDAIELNPVIHVLKPYYNSKGNSNFGSYQIDYVGKIDKNSVNASDFIFRFFRDISGFEKNTSTNELLILGSAGIIKIEIDKNTGMPFVNSGFKRFDNANTPIGAKKISSTNSFSDCKRIDCTNANGTDNGYTIVVGRYGQIITFSNSEYDSDDIYYDYYYKLGAGASPNNLAYMSAEATWYITDYSGSLMKLARNGKYLGSGGKFGSNEGNNELYYPIAITPNPIEDQSNDFRYRFMIATEKWGFDYGMKIFSPNINITEINVFESTSSSNLNFTFNTSNDWNKVEKATGIQMNKVLINQAEINSSLWNTQIVNGDNLINYPNIFSIDPSQLSTLKRGLNTVEIQLMLYYSDRNPELISNTATFYWLPSQFTGTSSDNDFINSSNGIDYIYKNTTLSGTALLKVSSNYMTIMPECTLSMQANSTFWNPSTTYDFGNVRFFNSTSGQLSIENGAYLCFRSPIAPSGEKAPDPERVILNDGYKTGKNPALTEVTSNCKSPCYALGDDAPKAVVTAQAVFNTTSQRYEAYADASGSTYSNSLRYVITKLDDNLNETNVTATVLGVGYHPERLLLNDLFSGFTFENQKEYKLKVTLGCNSDQGTANPEWIESSTVTTIIGLKVELKLGEPQTFCERDLLTSITGFTPIPQIAFDNSRLPQTGFWSGPGVNFAGVLSITGDIPRNTGVQYAYTFTDELNFTQTAYKTITITSAPAVSQFTIEKPVCAGEDLVFDCVGNGLVGTNTFYWSGVNNFYRATTYPQTYIQEVDVNGNGMYSVQASNNGCVGDPVTVMGIVYSLPGVSAGLDEVYCVGTPNYTITGFSPDGGLWQGTGIVNSTSGFNTALSGAGIFPVNYSFTDERGCTGKSSKNITVGPIIATGGIQYVCKSDEAVLLTVTSPLGGDWSMGGNTLAGGWFVPSVPGTYLVNYAYSNGICSNTAVKTVTVRDLPVPPAISSNSPVCQGSILAFTITGIENNAGNTYEWFGADGYASTNRLPIRYGIDQTNAGEYKLRIKNNGCGDPALFATTTVTVNALPLIDAGSYNPICFGNSVTLTGIPANGTWTGANLTGNVFTPQDYGTKIFTYVFTDFNGCNNSTTTSVIVNPQNTVTILGLQNTGVCRSDLFTPWQMVADPTAGSNDIDANFTFQWSKDGVAIAGATEQAYSTTVSGTYCVSVTSDCGGTAVDCQPLLIVDVPVISLNPPTEICKQGVTKAIAVSLNNPLSIGHPIQYTLIKGVQTISSQVVNYTGSSNAVTISSGGDYTIYVKDQAATYPDGSCATSFSFTTVEVDVPNLYVTTAPSSPVCQNSANIDLSGSVNIQGGVWTGTGVTGNIFYPSQNAIGNNGISYTYTNGGGCSSTVGFNINVTPLPVIGFNSAAYQFCNNGNSALTPTFTGTGTITYSWQKDGATVPGTSATLIPTANGNYCATISNECGSQTACTNVQMIAPPAYTTTSPTVICASGSSGTIAVQLSVPNGSSSYQYQLFYTGQTNPLQSLTTTSFNINTPGNYTIRVIETSSTYSCSLDKNLSISQWDLPVLNTGTYAGVCYNSSAVVLNATPIGGTWSGTGVSLSLVPKFIDNFGSNTIGTTWTTIDTDNFIGSSIAIGSGKLNLSGRGSDVWGTTKEFVGVKRTDITGNFDMSVKVESQNTVSAGAKAGIMMANDLQAASYRGYAIVAVTTGSGFMFVLDQDNNGSLGDLIAYSPLSAVSYPCWIRLKKTGTAVSAYYKTSVNGSWVQIGSNQTISGITSNSQIALFSTANTYTNATTTVIMDDFQSLDNVNSYNFTPANSLIGTNTVSYSYTDGNGCANTASTSIQVKQATALSLQTSSNQFCQYSVSGLNAIVSGNNGPFIYKWTLDGTVITTQTGASLVPYGSGKYCVQVDQACDIPTACQDILIVSPPTYTVTAPSSICVSGTTKPVNIAIGNYNASHSYGYQIFNTGNANPLQNLTSNALTIIQPGNYTVRLIESNAGLSCYGDKTFTSSSLALPSVNAGTYSAICFNALPILLNNGNPNGGIWNGSGLSGNNFPKFSDDFSSNTVIGVTWSNFDTDNYTGSSIGISSGKLNLSGRGQDVWGTTKELVGIKRTDITGDFDVSAKVESQNTSSGSAKAGIMMANDLQAASYRGYAVMAVTTASGFIFGLDQNNDGSLGDYSQYSLAATVVYPCWIRLKKAGTTISGYYKTSVNGSWVQLGSNQAVTSTATNSQIALFSTANTYNNLTTTVVMDDFQSQDLTANFTPANSLAGNNTINYTYTDGNGCSNTASTVVQVKGAVALNSPSNTTVCEATAASFAVSGANISSYQWQYATFTTSGGNWLNLASVVNGVSYNGFLTSTLTIPNAAGSINGFYYRCVAQGLCDSKTSDPALLIVKPIAVINTQPSNSVTSIGTTANFSVLATGTSLTYDWQEKVSGGNFTSLNATSTSYSIASVTPFMNGNQYRVLITSNGCVITSTSANLTINVNVWLGTTSTDWSNSANWSLSTPSASVDSYIPSGTLYLPAVISSASSKSLYVATNANLTVNSALNLYGDFINNGNVKFSPASSLNFANSGNQTISGSSNLFVTNVVFSGTGSKSINSQLNVSGTVTLANGNVTINSNGNMVLASNVNGTARIATIPDGGVITGNVMFQNYMGAKINSRFLSFPVQNAPISQLQTAIWVTGDGPGFDLPSGTPTIFTYNETVYGTVNFGTTRATSTSQIFEQGKGYRILVRSRTNNPAETQAAKPTIASTLSVTGILNQGNLSLPLTYTNTGNSTADGWNWIGNPYPSPIDWDASGWTKTNINPSIYFSDPGSELTTPTLLPSQTYTYIPGTGCVPEHIGCNSLIAQGQAVQVQASGENPVINITEQVKSAGTPIRNFRQETNGYPQLRISVNAPNGLLDETLLRFGNEFKDTYEASNIDVMKLMNDSLNLSTQSTDKRSLVMNSVSADTNRKEIPLVIGSKYTGVHQFRFANVESMNSNTKLFLKDVLEDTLYAISDSFRYDFTLNSQSNPDSRFWIVIENRNSLRKGAIAAEDANIYPNPLSNTPLNVRYFSRNDQIVEVEVNNSNGIAMKIKSFSGLKNKLNNFQIDCGDLPNGVYTVNIKSNGASKTFKLVKI